jgi:pimeloyl-ACP methyl ester carboxylesterase
VTPENLPGLLARAERLREKGMRGIMDESLATGYPEAMRALNPDHFALFRNRWLANDPESLRAQFLMLAGMDLRKELAKVTCPVLAISGRHDRLRPTSYVNELLQVVADARLSVVDAGHHMPDQAPEAVAAEILAFARDLTDRRTGAVA